MRKSLDQLDELDHDQISGDYPDVFAALLPPDAARRHRRAWLAERGLSDEQIEEELKKFEQ